MQLATWHDPSISARSGVGCRSGSTPDMPLIDYSLMSNQRIDSTTIHSSWRPSSEFRHHGNQPENVQSP
ncbi:hypothetical protein VTN96DRAFT_9343 [Rasamsonia emersonii]